MQLARDVVALEINLDVSTLYHSGDRSYIVWVRSLCNRVEVLRRLQAEAAKKG